MNEPAPIERILDGHSDSLGDLQRRVDYLETQVRVMRDEIRDEIKAAAHELRDDSDFSGPYWRSGVGHMSEHMLTRMGRWLVRIVGYALGAAALALSAYWYGLRK
jgi:hypothetical protein